MALDKTEDYGNSKAKWIEQISKQPQLYTKSNKKYDPYVLALSYSREHEEITRNTAKKINIRLRPDQ